MATIITEHGYRLRLNSSCPKTKKQLKKYKNYLHYKALDAFVNLVNRWYEEKKDGT